MPIDFQFIPNMNVVDPGMSFMTQVLCLLEFSGGYKLYALYIWCIVSTMPVNNPYKGLAHQGSLIDGARAWRHFYYVFNWRYFSNANQRPSLLTTLAFCQWYSKSNTIELEHDLYHTGLTHIHRHYTKATTKPKPSKIVGFKE